MNTAVAVVTQGVSESCPSTLLGQVSQQIDFPLVWRWLQFHDSPASCNSNSKISRSCLASRSPKPYVVVSRSSISVGRLPPAMEVNAALTICGFDTTRATLREVHTFASNLAGDRRDTERTRGVPLEDAGL